MTGERGYFLVNRGELDHPALNTAGEPFNRVAAWIWLLEHAAFAEMKVDAMGQTITLQRGQLCRTYRDMARAWNRPAAWVQRFITRLSTDTLITTSTDTSRLVITICNYNEKQSVVRLADTGSQGGGNTPAIQQRYAGDTQKKEGKESKEDSPLRGAGKSVASASGDLGDAPPPEGKIVAFPEDASDRLKRQLWDEGLMMLRQMDEGLGREKAGVLIGSLAKAHGGGAAGGVRAIQAIRDAQVQMASGNVRGNVADFLWGMVKAANKGAVAIERRAATRAERAGAQESAATKLKRLNREAQQQSVGM